MGNMIVCCVSDRANSRDGEPETFGELAAQDNANSIRLINKHLSLEIGG
jgi:hypothetical protein